MRESLGVALLAGGYAEEAEQVLREDLRRNPRNRGPYLAWKKAFVLSIWRMMPRGWLASSREPGRMRTRS